MKTITLIILLLTIMMIITAIYFIGGEDKKIPFTNSDNLDLPSDLYQRTNPDNKNPSGSSTGGEGSSGSSSGESSPSSGGDSSQKGCEERQISYSLTNPLKTSTCNEFQDGTCIDKSALCSIDVKNLDYTVAGIFTIEFTFFDLNDESFIIQTTQESNSINSREIKTFSSSINIQSPDANKEVFCSYLTLEAPIKIIC